MTVAERLELLDTDVARGEMRRVRVGEMALCVAHTELGEWWAIDDTCSHEDCSLSQGELVGREVECPCHGSRFDLRTGEPLCLPAVLPVATYPVHVAGHLVRVEVDQE